MLTAPIIASTQEVLTKGQEWFQHLHVLINLMMMGKAPSLEARELSSSLVLH